MLYYIILYYVMLRYIILYYIILYYTNVMLYYIILHRNCREYQNTHLTFKTFLPKIVPLLRQCGKI